MADFKVDPQKMYVCAVPFVLGDNSARSYHKGARVRGDDPLVARLIGEDYFVPESEASTDALNAAFSRNWNRKMDPERNDRRNAENLARQKAIGAKAMPGDDLIATSAKKLVRANANLELAYDEKGQITGAVFTKQALEQARGEAGIIDAAGLGV